MKKGDVVTIELFGKPCKARITATTQRGFRVVWLTGFLKTKAALIDRELLVHRGRPKKEE